VELPVELAVALDGVSAFPNGAGYLAGTSRYQRVPTRHRMPSHASTEEQEANERTCAVPAR